MPSTQLMILGRDFNGYLNNYYGETPFSTQFVAPDLAANVVHTYTVPPGITTAYFEYSKAQIADVFVGLNVIPVPPGSAGLVLTEDGGEVLTEDGGNVLLEGSSVAGSGMRLNPLLVTVAAGDTLSLVASADTVVVISYFTRNSLRQF